MEQTKYDVFISYSRKDYVDEHKNVIPGNVVSKIKDVLTQEGITYWFDEEGIYSGQNFAEKIVTNIEASKIFVFLSTANSNSSKFTCKEIASADEFGKHIIPVRIDSTPYNKNVLFRIADLDYIEYYTNPEKGVKDLISSIKTYLEELQIKEKQKKEEEERQREINKKKQEEAKKLKEQEEKRRQEKQKKIISEIKLSCTTLNNEETKIEIDRENLLLKTEMVSDEDQRESLKTFIANSGPIRQKCKKVNDTLKEEIRKLNESITQLETSAETANRNINQKNEKITQLEKDIERGKSQIENSENERKQLVEQIEKLQKEKDSAKWWNKERVASIIKRLHVIYGLILLLVVVGCGIWLVNVYHDSNYWEKWYNNISDKHKKFKNNIAAFSPLIATEIQVKNKDEEWNSRINHKNTSYLYFSLKYIGIKSGSYQLNWKLYDSDGLSQSETSPWGYSFREEVQIEEGENVLYSSGWGGDSLGYWKADTYTIEVWLNDRILAKKTFQIY